MDFLKSAKYMAWFIFASIIGSFVALGRQILIDETWLDKVIDAYYSDMDTYIQHIIQVAPFALIVTDILIILPILINSIIRKKYIGHKLSKKTFLSLITLGLLLNLIISACCDFIPFPKSWTSSLDTYTNAAVSMSPLFTIICTGILAPVMEELVFRYGILGSLRKKGPLIAIGISSVSFGIMHMNIIQGSYACVMGIILGYFYWKTENINTSILLHITVNLSSVLTTFLPFHELISLSIFLCVSGIINYFCLLPTLKQNKENTLEVIL